MFKAVVTVMLKKSVLDPQGAAVERALKSMGHSGIESVRIGKSIEIVMDGRDEAEAAARVGDWADKVLANPVMETYAVAVEKLK
jgi:phosphoribosylformylglycinamidine synthase